MTLLQWNDWHKVDRSNGFFDCWVWRGEFNRNGYGRITFGTRWRGTRRRIQAHRVIYELLIGPIPTGLTLDHLCRNRACVNPAHLEPVTDNENRRRGRILMLHCPRGHAHATDSYIDRRGHRICRVCHRERNRIYEARRKAVAS